MTPCEKDWIWSYLLSITSEFIRKRRGKKKKKERKKKKGKKKKKKERKKEKKRIKKPFLSSTCDYFNCGTFLSLTIPSLESKQLWKKHKK